MMPQGLIENTTQGPHHLIHNEPKFEVEVVLKSKQLRGRKQVLGQVERIPSNRGILGE
jgi:hypothetical protein